MRRSVQQGPFLSLHSCTALVMATPISVCGLNYGSAIFYPVSHCWTFVFSFSLLEIKWNSVCYSTIPKLEILTFLLLSYKDGCLSHWLVNHNQITHLCKCKFECDDVCNIIFEYKIFQAQIIR